MKEALGDGVDKVRVSRKAHLQLAAEVLVELLVALPVLLEHPGELAFDLLFDVVGDELELPVVLEELPGDVQGCLNGYGAKRELLEDLLLFYSSTEKKLVTLSEYVDRMPESQNPPGR
mgnify:CR=1 FL=1